MRLCRASPFSNDLKSIVQQRSNTPRGRPRDPLLRGRILKSAREQFLTYGASVSLDAIAQAARTSKVTLYRYFQSKEDLFIAMLSEEVETSFQFAVDQLDPNRPSEALLSVGLAYLNLTSSNEIIAQMRILYSTALNIDKVAASFFTSGPQALTIDLAGYLARVPHLRIVDAHLAAEQFLSMVRGNEQIRGLLGLPPCREGAKRRSYVEACVAVFMHGYFSGPLTSP